MTRTHDLETTLRSLDAAAPPVPAEDARARADLHRILALDPCVDDDPNFSGAAGMPAVSSAPQGRATRRLIGVGALVAAVTAGLLVVPAVVDSEPAYASWTAVPGGLSPEQAAEAADSCRSNQSQTWPEDDYVAPLAAARTAIAERRGEWTTVVLAGDDGFSALCITGDSAWTFDESWFGSVGWGARPPLDPRELRMTDGGTGTGDEGDLSVAAGLAGEDVTAMTYASRSHGKVTASVNDGRFALWLPGDELEDAPADGVDVQVTYRDGTTSTRTLSFD